MRRSERLCGLILLGLIFSTLFCMDKKMEKLSEAVGCLEGKKDPHSSVLKVQDARLATIEGQMEFLDRSVEKIWNGGAK